MYIDNLNAPLDQLHQAAEELLYLERLADIQLKMAAVAKGIDLETLLGKIDRSIRKHIKNGLIQLTVQRYDLPSPDLRKNLEGRFAKKEDKGRAPRKERHGEKPIGAADTTSTAKFSLKFRRGNCLESGN